MSKRWLVASLLLASCGGDDSSGPLTGGETIGTAGGTIELGNGVTVEIPEGALSEDVDIAVTYVDDLASLDLAELPVDGDTGGALILEPHGTLFDAPVTVTMPYDLAGDTALWHLPDEEATAWDPDGAITMGDGELSFDVLSFSLYVPQALPAESCPCWTGAELATLTGSFTTNLIIHQGRLLAMTASSSDDTLYTTPGSLPPQDWYCARAETMVIETTSEAEHDSCTALLAARFLQHHVDDLEIRFQTVGLDPGTSVDVAVEVDGAPWSIVTVLAGEYAVADDTLARGATVTATIESAPAGKTCTTNGAFTLGTTGATIAVFCTASAPGPCDDDLAGTWVSDETPPADYVVTGTKGAFMFDVPGGNVTGSVDATGAITATLMSDSAYPAMSSTYACTASGPETMHFEFGLKGGIVVNLTAE